MNCKQTESVMLEFGLNKYEMSEETNFQIIKNGRHKVILERLKNQCLMEELEDFYM